MLIFDYIYWALSAMSINDLNLKGLQIVSGKEKTSAPTEYEISKGTFVSADILFCDKNWVMG